METDLHSFFQRPSQKCVSEQACRPVFVSPLQALSYPLRYVPRNLTAGLLLLAILLLGGGSSARATPDCHPDPHEAMADARDILADADHAALTPEQKVAYDCMKRAVALLLKDAGAVARALEAENNLTPHDNQTLNAP